MQFKRRKKKLKIRNATENDYLAIKALYEEADYIAYKLLPDFFKHPSNFMRNNDVLKKQIEDESSAVVVAEDERGILGLSATVLQETPKSFEGFVERKFAELVDLVVSSSARREGIATKLIAHAENWAKESGAESIDLTVVEGNSGALVLYQQTGYEMRSHRMWKKLDKSKD